MNYKKCNNHACDDMEIVKYVRILHALNYFTMTIAIIKSINLMSLKLYNFYE